MWNTFKKTKGDTVMFFHSCQFFSLGYSWTNRFDFLLNVKLKKVDKNSITLIYCCMLSVKSDSCYNGLVYVKCINRTKERIKGWIAMKNRVKLDQRNSAYLKSEGISDWKKKWVSDWMKE